MLTIRLTRMGKKKKPAYRVVVIEKANARDGRFVEVLGNYDPGRKVDGVHLNKEKYDFWISRGAQPSQTVRSLARKVG